MKPVNAFRGWWSRSLSRRLLVVSAGTILFFLLVLSFLISYIGRAGVYHELTQHNDHLARLIAKDIDSHFNNIWSSLTLLSASVCESEQDDNCFYFKARVMLELRHAMPLTYRALYLVGAGGELQIHLADPLEDLLTIEDITEIVNREPIPMPSEVRRAYRATQNNERYFSATHILGADQVPVVYFALRLKGSPSSVVVAEIDLRDIWRRLDEIYVNRISRTFVVSREGVIIAHPDRAYIGQPLPAVLAPVLANYEGHSQYIDPVSGAMMLASYSPVGGRSGWGLVVEQEHAQAFATIDTITLVTLGVLSAAMGMAMVATALVARSITRPLQDLAKVTRKIAQTGDLDQKIVPKGQDEVGQLAAAFAQMIASQREAKNALAQERNLLRTLIDTLPDYVFIKDREGRLLMVNEQGVRGRQAESLDEVIGKTDFDFVPVPIAEKHRSQEQTILQSGEPIINHEEYIVTHLGETKWFLTTKAPFRDSAGNIAGIVGISRNITERKQNEEAIVKRTNALQTLHDVALNIGVELEMSAVLRRIAEGAMNLLDAKRGAAIFLHVYDPDEVRDVLHLIEACGPMASPYTGVTLKTDEGFAGQVFQSGKPFIVNDYANWPKRPDVYEVADAEIPKTLMGLPLLWREQVEGVLLLSADARERTFRADDIWLAEMFAAKAALAIKNSQLYQELETYSKDLEKVIQARTAELRHTIEHIETILRNSPDALLLLVSDGAIETFNKTACEMFGYASHEVCGRKPTMLFQEDHADILDEMLSNVVNQRRSKRLESVAQRKDGSTFDAEVAVAPVVKDDDTVTGLVCSLRDISMLKEMERLKDAFVTNISHQFRTPVTAIKLYVQLLQKQPEKREHYIQVLAEQANRLELLVRDVMGILRLSGDSAITEKHPVSLATIIGDIAKRYQSRAEVSDLTLIVEPVPAGLPLVQGDPTQLAQALGELVDNAVAFTPAGGHINIWVEAAGPDVRIIVQDDGLGIPVQEQARIFDRFYRGHLAEAGHIPGTGLGLAIAKEIVEQHQGRIDLESKGMPGSGTRFVIWLPGVESGSNQAGVEIPG